MPDRYLAGLLVVLGVLFLSEHFVWFPFNEYKGCTVLIAAAILAVSLVLLLPWFVLAAVLRRRFEFSLRWLLVLVTICGFVFGWLGMEAFEAIRQSSVSAALRAKGYTVDYTYEYLDPLFNAPPARSLSDRKR